MTEAGYTSVGGELLQIRSVCACRARADEDHRQVGDVMKGNPIDARAAMLRSISPKIGVSRPSFDTLGYPRPRCRMDATPKDGPSAGFGGVTRLCRY